MVWSNIVLIWIALDNSLMHPSMTSLSYQGNKRSWLFCFSSPACPNTGWNHSQIQLGVYQATTCTCRQSVVIWEIVHTVLASVPPSTQYITDLTEYVGITGLAGCVLTGWLAGAYNTCLPGTLQGLLGKHILWSMEVHNQLTNRSFEQFKNIYKKPILKELLKANKKFLMKHFYCLCKIDDYGKSECSFTL